MLIMACTLLIDFQRVTNELMYSAMYRIVDNKLIIRRICGRYYFRRFLIRKSRKETSFLDCSERF